MSTPLSPNAELAYATLDHVLAHPELHNQGIWTPVNLAAPVGAEQVTECGTGCCYGGWVALLTGKLIGPAMVHDSRDCGGRDKSLFMWPAAVTEKDGTVVACSVHDYARDTLGIDDDVARDLFAATNSPRDLTWLVPDIFGPRPQGETR